MHTWFPLKRNRKHLPPFACRNPCGRTMCSPLSGDKKIDSFKITNLNDFLYDLYSKQGKSYAYTEGFPKFFYLLFGYAYTKVNETAKNFM